jgi:hypothetical protein
MASALLAAVALGAIMTLGDWTWAVLGLRHRVAYGIVHGAAMCLCLGAAVGLRERRLGVGAAAGPVIGVLAASAFYVLAPWLRLSAMFPAWMLLWVLFALLQARLRGTSMAPAAVVGGIAAVFSGLAFYSISGIWTRHDAIGVSLAIHYFDR